MKTKALRKHKAHRTLDVNEPHPDTALHVLAMPVHYVTEKLHLATGGVVTKRRMRYVVGGFFMVTGASVSLVMGEAHVHHVFHVLIDVVAWTVHGVGSVPYATWAVKAFQLE